MVRSRPFCVPVILSLSVSSLGLFWSALRALPVAASYVSPCVVPQSVSATDNTSSVESSDMWTTGPRNEPRTEQKEREPNQKNREPKVQLLFSFSFTGTKVFSVNLVLWPSEPKNQNSREAHCLSISAYPITPPKPYIYILFHHNLNL